MRQRYDTDFLQFIQDNELVSECYIVEAFFDNLDDVYDFHITIRFKISNAKLHFPFFSLILFHLPLLTDVFSSMKWGIFN